MPYVRAKPTKPAPGRADECRGGATWDPGPAVNDEWLATLSHELRDPLAAVLYALEEIADDRCTQLEARRVRAVAERQARRALQIVDDLFDVCADGRGKLSLRKQVVSLADLVTRAIETASHLLDARRHRLTASLLREAVTLCGDPLRLEQVLTNLLANAAKYTDPGGDIRLTAVAEAGQVAVRVRDNGRGITPDLLPRVFDLFHRGPDSRESAPGGLGLGLALAKSLVESHGGSVAAFSDGQGTGSEFVVRLPTREP